MAGSFGGILAVREILGCLPVDFPVPILYIHHLSDRSQPGLSCFVERYYRPSEGAHVPLENPSEILLVEDNPGDIVLFRHCLRTHLNVTFTRVPHGEAALELLLERKTSGTLPQIILLDLHMPRMNGHEFLARIKEDPQLRSIPVVVFSSSELKADILKSLELGASSFVSKPRDLRGFTEAVDSIVKRWLRGGTNSRPSLDLR